MIKDIIVSWWKWITGKRKVYALRRLSVCLSCDRNKNAICIDCGCVIYAKVNSKISECEKWQYLYR